MASIISGYEYDIFLSYRKNDNKRNGWVTEFSENLKQELEATLKEHLSVYFDENQHDGLLETDNVNKSLDGKLNCLIFIPIISQIYCDPKSFAWQHEFCVFNKLAKADHFGRDVRLTNGNVACRILPVKIHDLDMDDKKLYEDETGGQLRGIDFIFTQPGVNRPLRPDDNRRDNLKRIVYLDQMNKLANSIKELINTLINFNSRSNAVNEKLNNNVSDINKRNPEDYPKRNSIIVLPFENISADPNNNYFSDGLTEEIISNLAHLRSLRVISRSTSMVFKGTSKDVITIGRELNVEYVLEGSVRKVENKIRITSQLIDARSDEHIWAERFDGSMEDIFDVQDKIARLIVDALKIELSPEEKKTLISRHINNTMAYDLWILAKNEFNKLSKEGIDRGIHLTKRAIEIEGDNAQLYATLAYGYWAYYDLGIKHDTEVLDLMDDCVSKSLTLDPNNAEALSSKGLILYKQGNLPEYVRFAKPSADLVSDTIYLFSFILAELGRMEEADTYAQKALEDNPLIYMSLWTRACVNMFMGKTGEAYDMIRYARDHFATGEPFAGWWVAQIAFLAGDVDIAYYEFKKVALSGSNPWKDFCKLFQLAIDKDVVGVNEHIQNSGLADFSKTDEYYPICIANSLALVGEYNEALSWLNRSVNWGFRNYKFLAEHNTFLEPLRTNPDFLNLIEKLKQKQPPMVN